ncbi:hypothetical protein [Brevirhabdus sp.]|uniref:hypothetical protein n=1 Tax=Brevirhabdus sp. TaxID=2004514 RepID=UPI0040581670
MKFHKRILETGAAFLVLNLGWVPQAIAQELKSTFDYRIVETDEQGQETLVARDSVRPGETIYYTLTHKNTADFDMAGLVIVAPVPAGVEFLPQTEESSSDAVFEVQAELEPEQPGLEWSTMPAMRRVVDPDGSERMEPLPASEIAAVRWRLKTALLSGEEALNAYRVVVE